jgi:hypothetical protein
MDQAYVKTRLIAVLQQIQALSGEACPALDGSLKPAESLPKFDSKVWPVAAGMLAASIGETIPPEANIFVDETTKQALTINEAVALVCLIVESQKKVQAVAAA